MGIRNDKLVMFNTTHLLNKREVVASIEDFIVHHQEKDNGEAYSESRRQAIIEICKTFLEKVKETEIPDVTKPFCSYRYDLKYSGIALTFAKYSDIVLDEEGELSEATVTQEYTLVEVESEYLSVEEYAKLSGVTDVTVRQWIRRGKLRTAKKVGGEWKISALSEPPKRGYEGVTYLWKRLPETIGEAFNFLPYAGSVMIDQDERDKKKFWARVWDDGSAQSARIELSTQARERLELMMIASGDVEVELWTDGIMYLPAKREVKLPYLSREPVDGGAGMAVVSYGAPREIGIDLDGVPGSSYYDGEPENYVIPIAWTFYDAGTDEKKIDAALDGDFSGSKKIGTLYGSGILCDEMELDGWNPTLLCDDIDADLGALMELLTRENAPFAEACGNLLYIHEFVAEKEYEHAPIKDRVLRELPWICKQTMHMFPELVAYFIGVTISEIEANKMQAFYEKNGFCRLGDSNLLYAYTD